MMDLEKEITKLEKFLVKEGRRDFVDAMRGADQATLDGKFLSLAKHLQAIKNTKANDTELKASKEKTSELGAPYREQLKMNAKLSRFIALMMIDQGFE